MSNLSVIFMRSELQAALQAASAVIAGRAFKPILEMVRIEAGDGVTIRATNLESAISVTLTQVQVESRGVVLVNCDTLLRAVREIGDDTLKIRGGDEATVLFNDGDFTLKTGNPDEFPPAWPAKGDHKATLPANSLCRLIRQTSFAVATQAVSFANGVLLKARTGKLIAAATDGRRMAVANADADVQGESSVVIPPVAARSILKMFGEVDGDATVTLADGQAAVTAEGIEFATNLLEGSFPPYEDVIPKDYDRMASVAREQLAATVRRVQIVSEETLQDNAGKNTKRCRLVCDFDGEHGVRFSARGDDGAAKVRFPCKYEGKPLTIGLNAEYLLEGLRAGDREEATIELTAPNRAVLLKCGDEYSYVQMPMNLNA